MTHEPLILDAGEAPADVRPAIVERASPLGPRQIEALQCLASQGSIWRRCLTHRDAWHVAQRLYSRGLIDFIRYQNGSVACVITAEGRRALADAAADQHLAGLRAS